MILRYTPRARQDLNEIKNYVKNELANSQAAARIVERILKGCSNLKSNPNLGLDLSSRIGQKTDLRYLVLSNYIAIYRVENTMVSIIRIMDGRTDYLRYLLSEI
ncbi:type II toxin-antitoxin system RelE/ParE family toxin [Ruminococcus sp. JE7B6]|uniref:type II toxin-antitoxin system RelE/ParE family toxin n=1 Tax=Ruminococcus sp. JE7B6 TaxID=3233380 RepID=UPI00389A5638